MFKALGTVWKLYASDLELETVQAKLLLSVDDFEKTYSRFLPDSLITKLNQGKEIVNPPPELLDMLTFAKKAHQDSDGVFNIFIGATLENTGYGLDNKNTYTDNFSQAISFDKHSVKIQGKHSIDFGGFGKGWLIDKLANELTNCSQDFVINGGGDIYVRGQKTITLESSDKKVQLKNQAIATSNPTMRRWNYEDKEYTHIPGSKTKNDIHVVATTATIADMLATASSICDYTQRKKLAKVYSAQIFS